MTGWQPGSCMNHHGMYRWFGVVPQGLVLPLLFSFLMIFGALSCEFYGGVLRVISCRFLVGCHIWGPCASLADDFIPRTPLNWPQFGGFSSCSSSWPTGPRSEITLDWEHFGSIPLRERSQLSLKFRRNLWVELGDRAIGSWGLTRGQIS
jgi:hypothetical protein